MSKITHKEAKEVQNTLPHSPHLCPCLIPRSPDTLSALFFLQGYRTLNHRPPQALLLHTGATFPRRSLDAVPFILARKEVQGRSITMN